MGVPRSAGLKKVVAPMPIPWYVSRYSMSSLVAGLNEKPIRNAPDRLAEIRLSWGLLPRRNVLVPGTKAGVVSNSTLNCGLRLNQCGGIVSEEAADITSAFKVMSIDRMTIRLIIFDSDFMAGRMEGRHIVIGGYLSFGVCNVYKPDCSNGFDLAVEYTDCYSSFRFGRKCHAYIFA